jgi:mannose-6-phosphate isomerase-like protein (cupin superfamily)
MNTVSTVIVRVHEGEGELVIKDGATVHLNPGDRVTIKPGEPYYFSVIGKLALNYIATPAWTPEQTKPIEE